MRAEFFDRDVDFESWKHSNPTSLVLNIRKGKAGSYAVLHRANCKTMNREDYESGAYCERRYRKVAAQSETELLQWSHRELSDFQDFSRGCSCLK